MKRFAAITILALGLVFCASAQASCPPTLQPEGIDFASPAPGVAQIHVKVHPTWHEHRWWEQGYIEQWIDFVPAPTGTLMYWKVGETLVESIEHHTGAVLFGNPGSLEVKELPAGQYGVSWYQEVSTSFAVKSEGLEHHCHDTAWTTGRVGSLVSEYEPTEFFKETIGTCTYYKYITPLEATEATEKGWNIFEHTFPIQKTNRLCV